jgi:hypothetical protein
MRQLLTIVLLLSLASQALATSWGVRYCKGKVYSGDTMSEILNKCGEPASNYLDSSHAVIPAGSVNVVKTKSREVWLYAAKRRQPVEIIFKNGVVVKVNYRNL